MFRHFQQGKPVKMQALGNPFFERRADYGKARQLIGISLSLRLSSTTRRGAVDS